MDGKGQLDPSVQISTLIDGNPELNARTETMSPSNIEDAPPENVDSNTKSVAADSHDFKSPALAQESNVIKSPTLSVLGNVQDEPCGNAQCVLCSVRCPCIFSSPMFSMQIL